MIIKKLFVIAIFFVCHASFSCTEFETIIVPKAKLVNLIGYKTEKVNQFSEFKLSISCDYFKGKDKKIPNSFNEAVILLNSWLDNSVLEKILKNHKENQDLVSVFDDYWDLAVYLEKIWQLKSDNQLSIELQKYGVYSTLPERSFEGGNPSWFVEALFQGVYEYKSNGMVNSPQILSKIGSYASINNNDVFLTVPTPPSGCQTSKIITSDITLTSRPPLLAERIIRWVKCDNDITYAYLWEQGWFVPDSNIENKIKSIEKLQQCLDVCSD